VVSSSSHREVPKGDPALQPNPSEEGAARLSAALELTKKLPFVIELSPRSRTFIGHLASYGEFRYIDIPYHIDGHLLVDLDLAVWEVRRYCQVLDVFGKRLPPQEQELMDKALADLIASDSVPRYRFRLHGGLLEKILSTKNHPSRSALIWQNAIFGSRRKKTVSVRWHLHAQNPHLYLYPEMLEELLKYVFIPDKLAAAYRAHLAEIQANPDITDCP